MTLNINSHACFALHVILCSLCVLAWTKNKDLRLSRPHLLTRNGSRKVAEKEEEREREREGEGEGEGEGRIKPSKSDSWQTFKLCKCVYI